MTLYNVVYLIIFLLKGKVVTYNWLSSISLIAISGYVMDTTTLFCQFRLGIVSHVNWQQNKNEKQAKNKQQQKKHKKLQVHHCPAGWQMVKSLKVHVTDITKYD